MSDIIASPNSPDVLFRPACHYASPADVLNDGSLSAAEKRVILSSWVSDMYTVESCPWLREVPGMTQPIRLKDIFAALRSLDIIDDDPPPRGAAAMKAIPFTRLKVHRRGVQHQQPAGEIRFARTA